MDAGAILHELTYATDLPREALHAASAQRVELLPKFLGVIEDYLGQEPAARANPTPLFFIFHLLGEWREKTAYRPLARLLRCPADEVDAIFGDATADDQPPCHGCGLRRRPSAALRHYSRSQCRGVHPVAHVRGPRHGHLARRTRSGSRPAAFSATPTTNCSRSAAASSGSAGKAPLRCSALAS